MPRVAATLACALLLAATASGCASSGGGAADGTFTPRTPGVLTVATEHVPTPDFWEGTPSHPTGGFEYELARALAHRFGLARVRVRIVPFQRIVAGHLGGADLALSLVTPTEERSQVLDFSAPYVDAPPVVLARSGVDVPDLATAEDLRWAAVRDTTLEDIIENSIAPTRPLLRVAATTSLPRVLTAGRADAALLDAPLGVAFADRSSGRLHVAAQLGEPEALAAALPQDSGNHQAADAAMHALVANGTVDRLAKRWLGSSNGIGDDDVPLLRTDRG